MKVLIVSEYFYPRLAGAELILWNITNAMLKKGHEITVITSRMRDTKKYEIANGIKIYRPFSSVDSVWQSGLASFGMMAKRIMFAIRLYQYFKRFLNENEIDLVYNLAYVPTIPTTWVASRNGIPVVTGIDHMGGIGWFQIANPIVGAFNCLMEVLILRFGKHSALRCPSEQVSKRAQRYTTAKVFHIPNPINFDEIEQVKRKCEVKQIRQDLGIEEDEQFLLYVGLLISAKNVDGLIESLGRMNKKFKLVIVGEGPQRSRIQRLIAKTNMRNKTILLGQKPHDQVLCMMNSCDILVLPSKSEVFPTVVLEALAFQRPVVATRVGGVSEIKSPNLYIVDSAEELCDMLYQELQTKPDDSIFRQYSLDKITSELESLFKNLMI